MKPKVYFSMMMRGAEGDDVDATTLRNRIDKAIAKADVLRRRFPAFQFIVPHEDEVVNRLHAKGLVDGDDIVQAECEWIIEDPSIVGVVVVGHVERYRQDGTMTGVWREFLAAHEVAHKTTAFIDDVNDDGCEWFATMFQKHVNGPNSNSHPARD